MHRLALLGFLVCIAVPSWAATGGIRVEVVDAESEPLVGATVRLANDHALIQDTVELTDEQGRVEFPVLTIGGGYVVEVTMPGFAGRREAGLRVSGGATYRLQLILGRAQEERVKVVGGTDVVDLEKTGTSTRFTAEFIETLPTRGRQYQNVLPRSPGVNDADEDGNPNVHGSRSRDFRAEVSGISNVDPLTGQWLANINQDSIEEMEIVATGAGVEYGRAQGGFARIVQKQGTNQFEGTFNFLYRSSKLDRDGASDTDNLPAAEFETLQPAINLSGPIVKDKLWYRLSHEWVRQEDPLNVLNDVVVTTIEQSIAADQLTWQVSPRNKLTFQWQRDPLKIDNVGVSTAVPAESTRTFESTGSTYSVNWVAPISPRILIDSRVAWQDYSIGLTPTDPAATQNCVLFFGIEVYNTSHCFNTSVNRESGADNETLSDARQRLSVEGQVTWYARTGSHGHQIKAGLRVENERYRRDLDRAPEFTFEVVDPPLGEPFGVVSTRNYVPRVSAAEATGNNWAVYVEDQWKPTINLSVTLGLRFDREEIDASGIEPFDAGAEAERYLQGLADGEDSQRLLLDTFTAHEDISQVRRQLAEALGITESEVSLSATLAQAAGFWQRRRRQDDIHLVNNNFAPRLSVAWDPWANGKTKVFASAGRYYDKVFLAVPLFEVEPVESRESFGAVTDVYPPLPGDPFVAFKKGVDLTPLTARAVDRNLSTPYQDEFTIGFEREVFTETALNLSYVRRNYRDQFQDVDINHLPGDHGICERELIQEPHGTEPAIYQGFVVPSPGAGQAVVDPFTGETWVDTEPGAGDGVLDDCIGDLALDSSFFGVEGWDIPDGKPDLYVQNPAWEELLLLGNFNNGEYRALVLEIVRRLYRSWELEASYVWSKAKGDAEDFDLLLGNEQNQREDEAGFLDFDQRHVVKLNAVTYTPWGWNVGMQATWQSGLPYSVLVSRTVGFNTPPSYPFARTDATRPRLRFDTGQRNDQRNPAWWNFDIRVAKEFNVRHTVLGVSFEVFNLLNDDTLDVQNITGGEISGVRRFGRRYQLGLRLSF